MRVSFDIDDTLVLKGNGVAREPGLLPAWLLGHLNEPLRPGSRKLFEELRKRGCEVWIYTSSLRSRFHIRWWLAVHGLWADGIVNDDLHRRRLEEVKLESLPSKYPPAFGIDLHIDDSPGVHMEGERFGFRVHIVAEDDAAWSEAILRAVEQGLPKQVP